MQIYEKIKLIRNLKGWSQEEIAHRLNIAASTYGSIERGETDVNLSRLQKIAQVFEMDLLELFSFGEGLKVSVFCENNNSINNWRILSNNDNLKELEFKDLLLKQKDIEINYLQQQNKDLREIIEMIKLFQKDAK